MKSKIDFEALRESLNLTQAEAAEEVGVNTPTWNLWENGHHAPRGKAVKSALEKLEKRAKKARGGTK